MSKMLGKEWNIDSNILSHSLSENDIAANYKKLLNQ